MAEPVQARSRVSTATLGGRTGTVTEFDDPRGLGVVTGDDGVAYPFHCAAIADGSRSIEVGTAVSFTVVAGRSGRWEAATITSPETPTGP